MAVWLYDCDMGQGVVSAPDEDTARREAVQDVGRHAQVRNLHVATPDELAFRRHMGGFIPE